MTVRVATLLRLSTRKQARRQGADAPDIPAQRQALAEFLAQRPDWVHVQEYQEAGVSAFKKSAADRDILQDALRDAASGAWSVLLVFKADRLSRNSVEYPLIVARLRQWGVSVWSAADGPGGRELSVQTQMDKFIRFLEGWQAETESVNTQVRVSARMRQLAREGRWNGSKVPFGYALVAARDGAGEPLFQGGRPVRHLVPHPEQAPLVRELFQRYLAGQGAQSLAAWLNAAGIPTYHRRQWTASTVRELLTNPLYAGLIVYGRSSGEPVVARGRHAALVDQTTWERACELRRERGPAAPVRRGGPYALSGVLRCGLCGSPMGGITRRRVNGAGRRVERQGYRCLGRSACPMPEQRAETVEAALLRVLAQLRQPGNLAALVPPEGAARALRRAAGAQLEAVRQALARVDAAYFEGAALTLAEYRAARQRYLAQKAQLEADLASSRPPAPQAICNLMRDLAGTWAYIPPDERKPFVSNLARAYAARPSLMPDGTVDFGPSRPPAWLEAHPDQWPAAARSAYGILLRAARQRMEAESQRGQSPPPALE